MKRNLHDKYKPNNIPLKKLHGIFEYNFSNIHSQLITTYLLNNCGCGLRGIYTSVIFLFTNS